MSTSVFVRSRYNLVLNENQRKRLMDILENTRSSSESHGEARTAGLILKNLRELEPVEDLNIIAALKMENRRLIKEKNESFEKYMHYYRLFYYAQSVVNEKNAVINELVKEVKESVSMIKTGELHE